MSYRAVALFAGASCVGLLASACTASTSAGPGAQGSSGGSSEVVTSFTSDVNTFDPAKASAASDYSGSNLLYSTLVVDQNNTIIPSLATKWKVTPSKATFTIRKGVTCSDGSTLTPKMVAAALRYLADPKTGSSAAPKVFGSGKVTVTSDSSASTVTVALSKPWSEMLHGLTRPTAGIPCSVDPKKLAAGKAPGTGPYTLTKAQRGVGYTFDRRDDYWGGPKWNDAPKGKRPPRMKVRIIQNESTVANELKTGDLDLAYLTGPDSKRFTGETFHTKKLPLIDFLIMFNERPGHPTAKKSVRDAIAAALDPKSFNHAAALGQGQFLTSIMSKPTNCLLDDPALLAKPDPATAKALAGVKLKVLGTNAVAGGAGNDYVQAALKDAGANVTLKSTDNATWASETRGSPDNWDVNVFPHLNTGHALISAAALFTGAPAPKGSNVGAVKNPAVSAAVGAAMSTVDKGKQCASWRTAQKALLKNTDVAPMVSAMVTYVLDKRLDAMTPGGALSLASLKIVQR